MGAAGIPCRNFVAKVRGFPMLGGMPESDALKPKQELLWANLLFNVGVPVLLLMKGEAWLHLPAWAVLVVSLAFPVVYFFHDLRRRGRRNIVSIIGFVSVLITGGVGLMHLPASLIAIKEAVVPSLFAVAIVVSSLIGKPIVGAFLLNPDFFDTGKIDAAVGEKGVKKSFDALMLRGTLLLALSFVLSAVLNYILARMIIHSESGTEAFNVELGRLHLVSYFVVALPATLVGMFALWHVVSGIRKLTGYKLDDIMYAAQMPAEEPSEKPVSPEKADEAKPE